MSMALRLRFSLGMMGRCMNNTERMARELQHDFTGIVMERDNPDSKRIVVDWPLLARHVAKLVIEARLDELKNGDAFYDCNDCAEKRIEALQAELKKL